MTTTLFVRAHARLGLVAILTASLLLTGCASTNDLARDEPNRSAQNDSGSSAAPADKPEDTKVESLPFNASGLLGGTAQPSFADGEPGKVSVVQIGPLDKDGGRLLFAFRNNTAEGISDMDWTATARSGGSIVATGSSQGTTPSQVRPGEVGLSYIYFDNSEAIPDDSEYEFAVSTSPVNTEWLNSAPFKVKEANLVGESIVGAAVNGKGVEATGPYSVTVYCFDGDNLISYFDGYTEQMDEIAPGGTVTFSVNLYGRPCQTFALGVSGYIS